MFRTVACLAAVWLALVGAAGASAEEKVLNYESGKLKARYHHTEGGALQGRYEVFHENGHLKVAGEYNNGQKVGTWVACNENGDTIRLESYDAAGELAASEAVALPFAAQPDTLLTASPTSDQGCSPPCRIGYACISGTCVTRCNPPCPAGTYCSNDGSMCLPMSAPRTALSQPKTGGDCGRQSDCARGYICFRNDCEREGSITTAGNVVFGITTAFCTGITGYAGLISTRMAVNGYDDHYYYDSYDGGHHGGYDEDQVLGTLFPVACGYALFGTLNQISRGKQASYLRTLGVEPSRGWVAAGWAVHAIAVATAFVTTAAFVSDEQDFAVTMTITNTAMLATSVVVNAIGYGKQRVLLRQAVAKVRPEDRRSDRGVPTVLPYAAPSRGGMRAGLVLSLGRG